MKIPDDIDPKRMYAIDGALLIALRDCHLRLIDENQPLDRRELALKLSMLLTTAARL